MGRHDENFQGESLMKESLWFISYSQRLCGDESGIRILGYREVFPQLDRSV